MPEYLRALAFILLIAVVVFALAKPAARAVAMPTQDFERRRNLWFGITLAAFLAHNFWLFVAATTLLTLSTLPRETNRVALFFFLLFAVPSLNASIPGLGFFKQLFNLSYVRLLSLTVLLPTFLALLKRPAGEKYSPAASDLLLAGYIGLDLAHQVLFDTLTNTMRYGFYAFIDVFLPYYVASRALRNLRDFRDVLMSFSVAAMVLAAIGIFEFAKHWLLYATLNDLLGLEWDLGTYLARGDYLRAVGTTGQAIALGYVIAVAGGLSLGLEKSVPNRMPWLAGMALLAGGLVAPLSRGPWVGAAVIVLVFAASGRQPLRSLLKLAAVAAVVVPIALLSPFGDRIIDHLPFVGTLDAENVAYRRRLLEMSIDIIKQNPIFGSYEYLGDLEAMRQGQGIIDIVNTYLGIALTSGLLGLGLFVAFFGVIARHIWRGMRALPESEAELHLLGRSLLSTLAGILVTIFTVSSITVIPVIYWSVAGFGLAYSRLLQKRGAPQAQRLGAAVGVGV